MINLIVEILTIMITFYISVIYGNTAIAFIGFAEVLFCISEYIWLIISSWKKQYVIKIPIAAADQGEDIGVMVEEQTYRKRGYTGKSRYKIKVKNSLEGKWQAKWLDVSGSYLYQAQLPGTYEFCLEKVKIYDCSGLFYIVKKVNKSKSVEVIPQIYSMPVVITGTVRNFFGDADVYDDIRPGHDSSEIFDVRSFRKGDKIQSIHWKLSAKADELIVKENSLPKACAVTVIANPAGHMNIRQKEKFIQLVAGLSFSIMDQKCSHYVAWYSTQKQDIVRARVDDEESFYIFLSYFLKDKLAEKTDAGSLYIEKYRMEHIVHLVVVNSNLTIKRGQDVIGKPKEQNFKKEMENLEIIL